MTVQQFAWLLANWQVILGVLVVSCLVAFGLLMTLALWTIIGSSE